AKIRTAVIAPPPPIAHSLQFQKLSWIEPPDLAGKESGVVFAAWLSTDSSRLEATGGTVHWESDRDVARNSSARRAHSTQCSRWAETACASASESSPSR